MKFDDIHIAVISHHRPSNIKKMEEITGCEKDLHWYLGIDEYRDYEHAKGTLHDAGKLIQARNLALDNAAREKKYCLMLDDDLVKIHFFTPTGTTLINFHNLVKEMYDVLKSTSLYLAGTASTTNRFFYHPETPLGLKHFIGGWCTLTKYGSIPRYDNKLKTKEDYDITLQHIKLYGGVVRINYLAPQFKHYGNAGGVVEYRTSEVEQDSIKHLKSKWGSTIRDNPKRLNEILLRIK